jgi:hypothetical protein
VLARERHQPVVTAARAARSHEPAREHPAAQERLELRHHVARQRAPALLHPLGEGTEVLAHEAVHHAIAHRVAGPHVSMCTAIRHRWGVGESAARADADRLVLPTFSDGRGVAAVAAGVAARPVAVDVEVREQVMGAVEAAPVDALTRKAAQLGRVASVERGTDADGQTVTTIRVEV